MARRRGTGAKSSGGLTFPPPSGPWGTLLLRLDGAVMQSVVENRVISDLHV
jgi:hypothetical protein